MGVYRRNSGRVFGESKSALADYVWRYDKYNDVVRARLMAPAVNGVAQLRQIQGENTQLTVCMYAIQVWQRVPAVEKL